MRLLQVTPRYPPQSGGVETHVAELSERLVDRGHEVTVVTADAGMDGDRQENRNGVEVRRYWSVAPGETIHVCPQVTTMVRRSEVDIVHAHNYHSLPTLFAALGVGDRHFVVTPHYHGDSPDHARAYMLSAYRPAGRWALQRADEVVAVSDWERSVLAKDLDVDPDIVPNGLDFDRFVDASPEDRGRPYLFCIGRLEQYKGVQYVIRALPELGGYDLVVAGTGPYRLDLERTAADVGVSDRVDFLGYVDPDRVPGLYTSAEVHLALSEFEAYGLTVAESLAAGTPSVVSETSALKEWADHDGCVTVRSTDPATVAAAVETAVEQDPSSEGILDWDEVVDRLERKYGALLTSDEDGIV